MTGESFQGVPILHLVPGSAAERAGVKAGDRVIFANGQRVDSLSAYAEARSVHTDRLELTVQRGQTILDLVMVFDV